MTATQLIAVAAALFFSSAVQSAVGFGMGMLAIPILLWSGLPLPQAVVIVVAGMTLQSSMAVYSLRRDVPWRTVAGVTAGRSVGVIVGVMLLGLINTLDPERVKQIIGAVLLLVVLLTRLWRIEPRRRVGRPWTVLAVGLSGIMSASVGMGGPPLVLWVLAHTWTATRIRAVLLGTFLATTPVLMPVLVMKFGFDALKAAGIGAAAAPLLFVGSAVGLRIGKRLSRSLLEKLALGLIFALALSSLAAPYLPWG